MKDESLIPKGDYCYDEKGNCPYWSIKPDLPKQENGYCSFIEKSDFEINEEHGDLKWQNTEGEVTMVTKPHEIPVGLLWDMCKECNVNGYTDKELEEIMNEQDKDNIL